MRPIMGKLIINPLAEGGSWNDLWTVSDHVENDNKITNKYTRE